MLVKTLRSDAIETIRLEAPVRQVIKHVVIIENPLKGIYHSLLKVRVCCSAV